MKLKVSFILLSLLIVINCGEEKAVPAEYAKMCDSAYNNKRVEIVGYLGLGGSSSCSSVNGSKMDCRLTFTDKPNETSQLGKDDPGYDAYVEKGDGNNMMADPGKSYKFDSLKIKDTAGKEVTYRDKVKLIGLVTSSPNPDGTFSECKIYVSKIEKQ